MIIGKYSPRQSRGEYFPKITEPEANNCFSIFTQVILYKFSIFTQVIITQVSFSIFTQVILHKLILFISLSVLNLHKTAASRHFVNLFLLQNSPVGDCKGMLRILDQSQRRISYVHLCKNTKNNY